MVWFKNAIIYQLNKDNLLDKQLVEQAVNAAPFIPCDKTESTKSGWISPYGENSNNPLMIDIDGQLLLRLKKESKILPSSVIKQALTTKIAKQEDALNRKLKKTETIALKEEVFIDLLPRAFSKYQFFWLWIDTKQKRLIVDSSSFKQAEDLLALLRKEMGSLAITPRSSTKPLENLMTEWVRNTQHYPPLELGNEIELKDAIEESQVVRCKNQDMDSNEIFVHIDAGKQVSKLNLIDSRGVSFMLNRDDTLKRIKFDASILDKNEDYMPEERDKKIEADFLIMSSTLSETIDSLITITD
ncbi:recombination associated protein RdgC [Orbus hercynius]|uniref:Recombination-associated protein RdgC n=1 Tax=Orbus hercynius TaxID=593135 RepID=A0A495RF65_9GAMM|nr:recombination-associated protein RdgC [Orbus hercynius]RKS86035.1 recombination associated protein RdgC [Orbus hercynius]